MAADYSKIINHPDKQWIITKFSSGESAKSIASYLKAKYELPEEKHLVLSENLLKILLTIILNIISILIKFLGIKLKINLNKKLLIL